MPYIWVWLVDTDVASVAHEGTKLKLDFREEMLVACNWDLQLFNCCKKKKQLLTRD